MALGNYTLFDASDNDLGNRAFGSTLDDGFFDLGDLVAVGPMADVLLSRAVKRSATQDELIDCLGSALHDPDQRKDFFMLLGVPMRADDHPSQPCPPHHSTYPDQAGAPFDDVEIIELALYALLKNLGPIAGVLVKQACASSSDAQTFVDELAGKLSNAKAREDFLAAMKDRVSSA